MPEPKPTTNTMPLGVLRPALAARIRRDQPDLSDDAVLSLDEINRYRSLYVEELLRDERGEISQLEQEVARRLAQHETISRHLEDGFEGDRTLGERLSDGMATFGGSWTFLILFAAFLALWMLFNTWRGGAAFDPYPYILLNLVLSTIAAIQAPIIMMSQRRQETKDRARALNDYRINLKAELEIRAIHEKLDHLISRQWEKLAEIQQMQIELINEHRRAR